MKRFLLIGSTVVLVAGCLVVAGCGLQRSAKTTDKLLVAVTEKDNNALLQISTEETKSLIDFGYTKDIYGEDLPLDYFTGVFGDSNLDDANIELKEENNKSAITEVIIVDKTFYLFFQKESNEWLFDLSNTITLSKLDAKNKTISGVDKYEPIFTKNDLKTDIGIERRYYQNKMVDDDFNPLPPVPVAFNLEGPWDFSQGPTDDEIVLTVIPKETAPDMADFPNASYVRRIDIGPLGHADDFSGNDDDSLKRHGSSVQTFLTKVPTISTNNPPSTEFAYPFKVGSAWQCSYQVTQSGFAFDPPYTVNTSNRVLTLNQLRTPFKSYDTCFLLQVRTDEIKASGTESYWTYCWIVPEIGSAVAVESVDGEVNEVFGQAKRIKRLKFFGIEQPPTTLPKE